MRKAPELIMGDSLYVLPKFNENSIDSVVTDPPYELSFFSKKWDSTGIAFNVELWCGVYRAMKPGAFLLAFSGSRTYHRMVCAIEDAGFEIKNLIGWTYAQGFPKSVNVEKKLGNMKVSVQHSNQHLNQLSWLRNH